MSADEYFKQLGYRSNVRAQLLREARSQGLEGSALGEYVTNRMADAFENGRGINKKAMEYAQDVTYTTPTQKGTLSNAIQGITTEHPWTKFLMPFVQTPSNILNWTWERTPVIRRASAAVRADLAAGGERAAMAQAKLGTGLAIWGTAGYLAATGTITGKGPDNPELRRQWRELGNQPYSIKVGDKWFEYKRLDPMLAPVGIVADLFNNSGEIDGEHISDMAGAFAAALASNITSKTYLASITNTLDALTSGEPSKMDTFMHNQLGSFVPNVFAQTNPDDGVRELRGYVDALLAKLPGSEALPPRYNILGEPVMKPPGELNRALNPFTVSGPIKGDGRLENELLKLGKAMPMPAKDISGVDLTSTQFGTTKDGLTPYDRMLKLIGNPTDGGPSLRQRISQIISSEAYRSLPEGATAKFDILSKEVGMARLRAQETLRREFPSLHRAILQAQNSKKAAYVQGDAGVQRIQQLFQINK
jgi:hypothetical protein